MQILSLSAIERTHGSLMFWWPIQSRRQLVLAAAFISAALLASAWIVHYFFPQYQTGALIGAAVGAVYCGIYRVLPARMTLATRGEARYFLPDLHGLIVSIGYRQSDQPAQPGRLHFCNKAPRWLSWDEQDLDVGIGAHEIILSGPIASLETLRTRLLQQQEG